MRARRAAGWREDPVKKHARNVLHAALRRGYIKREPCEVCAAEPAQAHHDDYEQPLAVRWLCRPHHEEHHARERVVPASHQVKTPGETPGVVSRASEALP